MSRLRFVVRTPQTVVLDELVQSVRVPTETGHVGLRPREEPILLAVEPGLILLRARHDIELAATAGGLLEGDRERAVLYTPYAAFGDDEDEMLAALDRALATPDSELAARRRLGELEEHIVQELRHRPSIARTGERHG